MYHFALLAPALVLALYWQVLLPQVALLLLFVYVFIYRTFLDGARLSSKNIIRRRDIWKMILPGMRGKYFKQLYYAEINKNARSNRYTIYSNPKPRPKVGVLFYQPPEYNKLFKVVIKNSSPLNFPLPYSINSQQYNTFAPKLLPFAFVSSFFARAGRGNLNRS